jgi:hypothetical protein
MVTSGGRHTPQKEARGPEQRRETRDLYVDVEQDREPDRIVVERLRIVTPTSTPPRHMLRSTAAVLGGFVAVVALSLGTDQVLHVLEVYPPWGQPMHGAGLNLLALTYRIVYAVVGSYIAARFAPHGPMRHALALGVVGLVLSLVGAIVAITMVDLGPSWYPVALVLTALPCAWLGGALHRIWHADR